MKIRTYKTILIGVLLANVSCLAFGQRIEGTFRCVVQDTSLQQINDGRSKSFKRYKGGLGAGDSFSLTYSVTNGSLFKLDSNKGDYKKDENLYIFDSLDLSKPHTSIVSEEMVADGEHRRIQAIIKPYDDLFIHSYVEIRKGSIVAGLVGNTLLSMRRYYKGDWMGMYTVNTALAASPIVALTYSFDCKHTSQDNWLEVFEILLKTPR